MMFGMVYNVLPGETSSKISPTDISDFQKKMGEIVKITDTIAPLIKNLSGFLDLIPQKDEAAKKAIPIVKASLGLTGSLVGGVPPLIMDLLQFPDRVKAEQEKLQDGFNKLSAYLASAEYKALDEANKKIERQKKLDAMFIYAADLSILVTNLMYKIMKLVKQVGPLILAIDETNGRKASDALQTAASIMKMLNKMNDTMKRQIIDKQAVSPDQKAAEKAATPKPEPEPELTF